MSDARPGHRGAQLPGAREDADVARGGNPARQRDHAGEPARIPRRPDGARQAAPAQAPGGAGINAREINRCQGQHRPRWRTLVRQELTGKDPDRGQRRPAHAARKQQRHHDPGVRIPWRDARVRQRFNVAHPVQEQVEPEIRRAGLPGGRHPYPAPQADRGRQGVTHGPSLRAAGFMKRRCAGSIPGRGPAATDGCRLLSARRHGLRGLELFAVQMR